MLQFQSKILKTCYMFNYTTLISDFISLIIRDMDQEVCMFTEAFLTRYCVIEPMLKFNSIIIISLSSNLTSWESK